MVKRSYCKWPLSDVNKITTCSLFNCLELEVPQVPFPRITMAEAHQMLKDVGYQLPPDKKNDLDPGAERILGETIKQRTGCDIVYITEWPFAVRPF